MVQCGAAGFAPTGKISFRSGSTSMRVRLRLRQKVYGRRPRRSSQAIFRRGCGGDSPPRSVAMPEMIEHEDPDGGRKIAGGTVLIDMRHQRRDRHMFVIGNLAQRIPELVFQRDARLVSVAYDRALDHGRILAALRRVNAAGGVSSCHGVMHECLRHFCGLRQIPM